MNTIKKSMLTAAVLAVLAFGLAGNAFATAYPYSIGTLEQYLNSSYGPGTDGYKHTAYTGSLAGFNYITALASEAGNVNTFNAAGGTPLFTNTSLPSQFGTTQQSALATSYFRDTTDKENFLIPSSNVRIYELARDWTLSNGKVLSSGSLILGLNDNLGCSGNDADYDDFILAASKSAPTPLPGAVWLLGSGLVGLMGFKRSRKNG